MMYWLNILLIVAERLYALPTLSDFFQVTRNEFIQL